MMWSIIKPRLGKVYQHVVLREGPMKACYQLGAHDVAIHDEMVRLQ